MKKYLLPAIIVICQIANAQIYQWAKSAGINHVEAGRSVAADGAGNVFVTGGFQGTSITFGTTTLINASTSQSDMYIVKYDVNGNVLWAKRAGGNGNQQGESVTTDAWGNVLVTGNFSSDSVTFDNITLMNANPNGPFTRSDIFLAKYDSNGNVIWAASGGGSSDEFAKSVAADSSGNIAVTGYFVSSTIAFDTDTLTNANGGQSDMLVVKFDSAGTVMWARSAGDLYAEVGNSVAMDMSGNVIVTGYFESPNIIFDTTTLTNSGFINMYIVKYDSNGNMLWAKSSGGNSTDYANAVAVDPSGSILMTGYFGSDTIISGVDTLINASNNDDVFLIKYNAIGNTLWARSAGGINSDRALSAAADMSGNILVTGTYNSPSITFGSDSLTIAADGYIFIVTYDPNGNVIWVNGPGGISGLDVANSIAVDNTGDVLIAGDFWSTTLTFGSTILTNAGNYDMFVVKLNALPVAINETGNFNNSILLFPNPSTTEVTINLGKAIRYDVRLCNTLGEVFFQTITSEEQVKIDVGNFSKGIYFVTVSDEKNNTVVRKMVKL